MDQQQSSSNLPQLDPEEFKAWVEHPATQRLMAFCQARREEWKEAFARGRLTAEEHSKAIGICTALDEVIHIKVENLVDES